MCAGYGGWVRGRESRAEVGPRVAGGRGAGGRGPCWHQARRHDRRVCTFGWNSRGIPPDMTISMRRAEFIAPTRAMSMKGAARECHTAGPRAPPISRPRLRRHAAPGQASSAPWRTRLWRGAPRLCPNRRRVGARARRGILQAQRSPYRCPVTRRPYPSSVIWRGRERLPFRSRCSLPHRRAHDVHRTRGWSSQPRPFVAPGGTSRTARIRRPTGGPAALASAPTPSSTSTSTSTST